MSDSPVSPPAAINLEAMQGHSRSGDLQLWVQHLRQLSTEGNYTSVHDEEGRQNLLGLLDLHLVVGGDVGRDIPRDVLRSQ